MAMTQDQKDAQERAFARLERRTQCDIEIKDLMDDGRCTQTTRKTLVRLGLATKAQANAYIRVIRKQMGIYVKNSGRHFNKSKKMKEAFI